jgi:ribosome production factor 1
MLEKPWWWICWRNCPVLVVVVVVASHPIALCGEDADKPSRNVGRCTRRRQKFTKVTSKQAESRPINFATKPANLSQITPSTLHAVKMVGSGSFRIPNKIKRGEQHRKQKSIKENEKRDLRHKRRRHEDKNPEERAKRIAKNVPKTLDSKRTWDDADPDATDGAFGASIDVLNPKRRKVEDESNQPDEAAIKKQVEGEEQDDDVDSMLGDSEDEKEKDNVEDDDEERDARAPSEAPSMATDVGLTPENLSARFPGLFNLADDYEPKVLITTSINSMLHDEAEMLTELFPNSKYVRRSAHAHAYKYSVREISKYAAAREFTHVVILNQALHKKVPSGLDIVFLPHGPMFHFSISNFVPGKKLPGHGNATGHFPELILNGFRTPLGVVAAHLFKSLFPPRPEIEGRQVVTLHNQRDYIFFRRHRYVFRDKRATEKVIQDVDGKPMKGAEEIRAGLQELGPRFTMKLRRVDKGIQRASGQDWEWSAHAEKVRTRFNL